MTEKTDVECRQHVLNLLAKAEPTLAMRTGRSTSIKSMIKYQAIFDSLEADGFTPGTVPNVTDSTRRTYKSAVISYAIAELRRWCRLAEPYAFDFCFDDELSIDTVVSKIQYYINFLASYQPRLTLHEAYENMRAKSPSDRTSSLVDHHRIQTKGKPKSTRATRISNSPRKNKKTKKCKKVNFELLVDDWKSKMLGCFVDDLDMQLALSVCSLVGVRPAELASGVHITMFKNGSLRFSIIGAKVTESTGQPIRIIELAFEASASYHVLADHFAQLNTNEQVVKIDDPRKFSDRIRYQSRKLYPALDYVISAYTYRHDLASRLKAQKVSRKIIAQVLGHVSAKSSGSYGAARLGKGKLELKLLAIKAGRAIRKIRVSSTQPKSSLIAGWITTRQTAQPPHPPLLWSGPLSA